MDYRTKLCLCKDIYEQNDALFMEAVRSNADCHILHCKEYRRLMESQGLDRDQLRRLRQVSELPCIPTLFLKHHSLYSGGQRAGWAHWQGCLAAAMTVSVTSSGTLGQRSRLKFDMKSLFYGGVAAFRLTARHDLLSLRPVHYVILGYPPDKNNRMMIARTQWLSTLFAPALSRKYALKKRAGEYRPDFEGVMREMIRFSGGRNPVRIIGFPAYLYFLLKEMENRGLSLCLPDHSMILLGGGWKQFYKEMVDKKELYRLAEQLLGIPEADFREFFGAAEHLGLYCDCPNHHFHIPATSRVVIRDADTLESVGLKKTGLVNLISPLAESMPLTSVLTDDLGILHPGNECGCGIKTPYLEIIGRIGVSGIRTCAQGAEMLLKEVGQDGL